MESPSGWNRYWWELCGDSPPRNFQSNEGGGVCLWGEGGDGGGARVRDGFLITIFIAYMKFTIYRGTLGKKLLLAEEKISSTFQIPSPKENGYFSLQSF